MQNISRTVVWVLFGITIILGVLFFVGEKWDTPHGMEPQFTQINLLWAYILFGITVVITLIFAVINLITHPKALKGAAIALAAGGVLVLISYLLASDQPFAGLKGEDVTAGELKWVGTGLYLMYIMIGLSFVSLIYAAIAKAFK